LGAKEGIWLSEEASNWDWRRLHSEGVRDLYYSPNINRVSISRTMRWAGHVARIEANISAYTSMVWKLGERDDLENLGIYGRIIVKWILEE
jgi:hypothetical protein